jgi:hypothetical protein
MGEERIDEAACACGQLRLRVRGGPTYVSSCACQACQRRTGAPFGVTAFYRTKQVVEQIGEARNWRRTADSGNWLDYRFCPQCGSTIWWEAQIRPGLVAVAGGTFADPDYPPPQRMVWTERRAAWVRPPEGVPEYPQGPPA